MQSTSTSLSPLSTGLARATAGLNLCHENASEVWHQRPPLDFLQIHPEHLIQEEGGTYRDQLDDLRHAYPIVLHGFGLSLGSCAPLDQDYLQLVKQVLKEHPEAFFSDHVSWSSLSHHHFHDLLPLVMNDETLDYMVERIDQAQELIGQPILLENIGSYMRFRDSTYDEPSFINALTDRTGAYVLMDVNNLWANAVNFGENPLSQLMVYRQSSVRGYHLAGCTCKQVGNGEVFIDYHGEAVHEPVWELYKEALSHFGPWPTLLEWENNVPKLERTLQEVSRVRRCLHDLSVTPGAT